MLLNKGWIERAERRKGRGKAKYVDEEIGLLGKKGEMGVK
jgi:hypothetical protein